MTEHPVPKLFAVEGRVACVTGASSGLGRRAAEVLCAAGAKVVGVARRSAALEAWQNACDDPNCTHGVVGDVADRDRLDHTVSEICAPFGTPDIVIHAAGLNLRDAADDVPVQNWEATLAVNLSAPFYLSQALVPAMKEKGWGRIITFASLQSFRAFPNGIAYGASKGGVAQLTRAMAETWSPHGITCNAIAPGFFETELTAPVFADPERASRNAAQTAMGRNGEPSDLDGPILFLCSQASAYVTGHVLMLDGGFTAK